jgi:hypothetical protein
MTQKTITFHSCDECGHTVERSQNVRLSEGYTVLDRQIVDICRIMQSFDEGQYWFCSLYCLINWATREREQENKD